MKIAALERESHHSPGMVDNDRAIIMATANRLLQHGHSVDFIGTALPKENHQRYDAIVQMTRSTEILESLTLLEKNDTLVVNSPKAVARCSRKVFTSILKKANIPQPEYQLLKSDDKPPTNSYPLWIKKAEGWSCHPQDVSFAANENEAAEAVANMRSRGIDEIICSQHIKGDIIKFYGVSGTDETSRFFSLHYPDAKKTKFGLEQHNDECKQHSFDPAHLSNIVFKAAAALEIDIFGGDCIVSPNGEIYIIDINDFPSFSACREKAAEAIATFINWKLNKR